jgi:hypothetical protein
VTAAADKDAATPSDSPDPNSAAVGVDIVSGAGNDVATPHDDDDDEAAQKRKTGK